MKPFCRAYTAVLRGRRFHVLGQREYLSELVVPPKRSRLEFKQPLPHIERARVSATSHRPHRPLHCRIGLREHAPARIEQSFVSICLSLRCLLHTLRSERANSVSGAESFKTP